MIYAVALKKLARNDWNLLLLQWVSLAQPLSLDFGALVQTVVGNPSLWSLISLLRAPAVVTWVPPCAKTLTVTLTLSGLVGFLLNTLGHVLNPNAVVC